MFVNHVHIKPAGIYRSSTLEDFLRLAEEFEIEGGVCFAPFSYEFDQAGRRDNPNAWLAQQIEDHPMLFGYGTLNPENDAASQVEEIVQMGFKGIKLHPAAQKFDITGSWARSAYEAMESHGLIADFHLGVHWHRLVEYDPLKCDEIAHHHPGLKMVFEHVGGWHYHRQVLAVIVNNQQAGNHLYAGIASVFDRESQRYWYLGAEGVEECRWQIGGDLLIYGLDFPFNQSPQIRRDLEVIRSLGWPDEDTEGLLGRNLKRLLGLIPGSARISGGDPNPA